jgi:molybdopterin converting factor small subunit
MCVCVEFYGIPRRRAGCDSILLPVDGAESLGTILDRIGRLFPELGSECLDGNRLRAGFLVNIDGNRFLNDPDTVIADNTSLLIMSSDAGG